MLTWKFLISYLRRNNYDYGNITIIVIIIVIAKITVLIAIIILSVIP